MKNSRNRNAALVGVFLIACFLVGACQGDEKLDRETAGKMLSVGTMTAETFMRRWTRGELQKAVAMLDAETARQLGAFASGEGGTADPAADAKAWWKRRSIQRITMAFGLPVRPLTGQNF